VFASKYIHALRKNIEMKLSTTTEYRKRALMLLKIERIQLAEGSSGGLRLPLHFPRIPQPALSHYEEGLSLHCVIPFAINLMCAMIIPMASLKTFQNKLGKQAGRKAYNAFHREYRKNNKDKFLKYWRAFHAKQKAAK
jgi:hypothetical protein